MNILLLILTFILGGICSMFCYAMVLVNRANDVINQVVEEIIEEESRKNKETVVNKYYPSDTYEFDDESLNE